MAVANNYYTSQVLRIFDINHGTLTLIHYEIVLHYKTRCFDAFAKCLQQGVRNLQTQVCKCRHGVHGALAIEGP